MTGTKTSHEDILTEEEWCCSNCQWKVLNEGAGACRECNCDCHGEIKDWEQYNNSLTEKEREEIVRLIFNPRELNFKDNKLAVSKEQFPNLEFIYANNCGLKEVDINHDGLTSLSLNGNELEKFDTDKVTNLEDLVISNNKIRSLEVKHLSNLKELNASNNRLKDLDVSYLEKLKKVNVSGNCYRLRKSKGNDDLWFVDRLEELKTEGCSNLEDRYRLKFFKRFKLFSFKEFEKNIPKTKRNNCPLRPRSQKKD